MSVSLLPDSAHLEALLGEEPRLRALARALLQDPAAADDVVQETLQWGAERPLPKGALHRYLGRVLNSRVLDRLRGERRRRYHESQDPSPQAARATVDVVAEAEIRQHLMEAVTGLPEPYRTTIWLRYYDGLPPREIAERMDVPVNTVRTRVRRGLEQLRRALDARHNGDRRAWTACLMPWAMAGKQTATTLTATILGAIVMHKLVVSAAAVLLLGLLFWMGASLLPTGASTPGATTANADGMVASLPPPAAEAENIAQLPETDRQPVLTAAPGTTSRTSFLLRVVRRENREPVPGLAVILFPEEVMSGSLGLGLLDGVTDEQGEILWEDVGWNRVLVFPALAPDWIDLEAGQHNERVHEVGLSFTIQGEVVDPREQPVAGAVIWTYHETETENFLDLNEAAVADSEGRYSVPILENELINVFARSPGRGPSRVAKVSRPEEGQTVHLRLTIGDEAGVIAGDVVSPRGIPIPGASVRVLDSTAHLPILEDTLMREDRLVHLSQRTDDAGRFRFEDVALGEATVMVTATGWAGTVTRVDVFASSTSQVRVTMSEGARVVGTIRDTNGDPVRGVSIEGWRDIFAIRTVTTDREGRYALENVQPGITSLVARPLLRFQGGQNVRDEVELADGEEFRWEPVLSAGDTIAGVVQEHGGAPLDLVYVQVTGEDGERRGVRTDQEGRFSLPQLRDQPYEVRAVRRPLERSGVWITVAKDIRPGGEERIFRFPQMPAADAHVVGRVLDSVGNPVVPVRLRASDSEHGTRTNHDLDAPDGTFRLGPMISGEWTLRYISTRHPRLEHTVTLSAGTITDLGDIRLGEAVPVEVLVREPAGLQDEVWAHVWGPAMNGYSNAFQVEGGHVILPPLGAGSYSLEIRGNNTANEVREFELVVGRRTNLEVDLQPGVVRSVQVDVPEGTGPDMLTLTTFDGSGRELVSWRVQWNPLLTKPRSIAFRPEAVRLVGISEDGKQGEAHLGSANIRLVLR